MSLTKDTYFFNKDSWWFCYDKTTTYNEAGELHSYNDKPALIFKTSTGKVYREEWYNNGKPHRDGDMPAVKVWTTISDTSLHIVEWYHFGKLHRNGYNTRGEQLPAKLFLTPKGTPFLEEYFIDGKLHNEDKPAYLYLNPNKSVYKYYLLGQLHNLNGPACHIIYDDDEELEYFIFGRRYTYEDYIKQKFVFNIIKNKVRKIRRKIITNILKTTTVEAVNGPDICNLIATYVY